MTIEKHDTTENTLVPVSEKYTLTIKEAASYFNIGTKKMRRDYIKTGVDNMFTEVRE